MKNGNKTFFTTKKDVSARYVIRQGFLDEFRDLLVWEGDETTGTYRPLIPEGPVGLALNVFLKCPGALAAYRRRQLFRQPLAGKRPDLDNFVKQVKDALNGLAWKDDGQVSRLVAGKFYALAPDGQDAVPCYEITITDYQLPWEVA